MKIATLLFTYARFRHTKQVLDALSNNTVLPTKLFVFQDGLKSNTVIKEHVKVSELIKKVDFCPVEISISKENKGLAGSIILGVTKVLREYDAVIVLEDDCVPSSTFIQYMNECLEKYSGDSHIGSISGYAWPQPVTVANSDIYFTGRFSSWGWATWKDRWTLYNRDVSILDSLYADKESSIRLARWGKDLSIMLRDWTLGRNDSWAVFFALLHIKMEWYTVTPVTSHIKNIGFDGTGVHCGVTNIYDTEINLDKIDTCKLLEFDENLIRNVECYYGAINKGNKNNPSAVIYGMGNYFSSRCNEVAEHFNIIRLMDRGRRGFYSGIEIITPSGLACCEYDNLIIMIMDREVCIEIKKELIDKYAVPEEKIKFCMDL